MAEDRVALDLEAIAAARYGVYVFSSLEVLAAQAIYASSYNTPGYPCRERCHACTSPNPGK
jgi:hypothetical protein